MSGRSLIGQGLRPAARSRGPGGPLRRKVPRALAISSPSITQGNSKQLSPHPSRASTPGQGTTEQRPGSRPHRSELASRLAVVVPAPGAPERGKLPALAVARASEERLERRAIGEGGELQSVVAPLPSTAAPA